jgi:hypothetical protein
VASEQIGAPSVPTLNRIRQRQERGTVAGCGGAEIVAGWVAQHHLYGGAQLGGNGVNLALGSARGAPLLL